MADRSPSGCIPSPDVHVSIVIPTLNEAARIEATLSSIEAQAPPVDAVVADGGSCDDTTARADVRACVVSSRPGRAMQMNAGAAHAPGDVLLFLHADTLLPPGAVSAVRRSLADPGVVGGTFRLRFDRPTPLLRVYGYCTRLPLPHVCFGDRGLFVRRSAFDALGGFRAVRLFEDLDMVRRLRRHGRFDFLPLAVTTAARRFEEHGPLRQQARNAWLWLRYLLGADPDRLAAHYPYYGERR